MAKTRKKPISKKAMPSPMVSTSRSNPPVIAVLEPAAAPNAYAIQFLDSHRVVFLVRQGKEASDEAALRKQIIDRGGEPLVVSFKGSNVATVFDTESEPGLFFRIIALVP